MENDMSSKLKVAAHGNVARITLANPDRHNAMGDTLIAAITAAFSDIGYADEVRAIVLAAEGRSFCAGGDLNWMRKAADYSDSENRADAAALGEMLRAVNEVRMPVIARVQGPAFGGGVGLLCCCDVVVAVPTAKFALSETRLGLVPGVISPFVLAAIGPRQARRYTLTGEVFDAAEARRIGLVHELVPEAELDSRIEALIGNIVKGGPQAVAGAKTLMRQVAGRAMDDDLMHQTSAAIAEARSRPEGREGVQAFLEKRRPSWIAAGEDED